MEPGKLSYVSCHNSLADTSLVLLILHIHINVQSLVVKGCFCRYIELGCNLHTHLCPADILLLY